MLSSTVVQHHAENYREAVNTKAIQGAETAEIKMDKAHKIGLKDEQKQRAFNDCLQRKKRKRLKRSVPPTCEELNGASVL